MMKTKNFDAIMTYGDLDLIIDSLAVIQSMGQGALGADLGETVLNLEHRDSEIETPEKLIEIITRNDSHAV
jgi:hypothetical protein